MHSTEKRTGAEADCVYQHARRLHFVESMGTLRPRRLAMVVDGATATSCYYAATLPVTFSYLVNRLT